MPGLVYHVICRGIDNQKIFKDPDDLDNFIRRLAKLVNPDQLQIYAFSLMPNHLHLLTRRLSLPLSKFMQRLLTSYSIYFNRRHKRKGHLFQNRYKSIIVDEDSYLLELIRYIHLNPIRANIVSTLNDLADWPFAGHSTLMGKIAYRWIDSAEILALFDFSLTTARERLLCFMEDGLAMGRRPELVGVKSKSPLSPDSSAAKNIENQALAHDILGNDDFISDVLRHRQKSRPTHNNIDDQRLEDLLNVVAEHFKITTTELCSGSRRRIVSNARAAVIWLASKKFAMPADKLAYTLGVGPTLVYKNLSANKGMLESDSIQSNW